LVWFGVVWFGLVWFGLVWFVIRQGLAGCTRVGARCVEWDIHVRNREVGAIVTPWCACARSLVLWLCEAAPTNILALKSNPS